MGNCQSYACGECWQQIPYGPDNFYLAAIKQYGQFIICPKCFAKKRQHLSRTKQGVRIFKATGPKCSCGRHFTGRQISILQEIAETSIDSFKDTFKVTWAIQ